MQYYLRLFFECCFVLRSYVFAFFTLVPTFVLPYIFLSFVFYFSCFCLSLLYPPFFSTSFFNCWLYFCVSFFVWFPLTSHAWLALLTLWQRNPARTSLCVRSSVQCSIPSSSTNSILWINNSNSSTSSTAASIQWHVVYRLIQFQGRCTMVSPQALSWSIYLTNSEVKHQFLCQILSYWKRQITWRQRTT